MRLKRRIAVAKLASSKKRMRQEPIRRKRNAAIKSSMRTAIKRAEQESDTDQPDVMNAAYSALDKAAKRNVIHPRNAARKKSRLMKMATAKKA